MQQEGQRSKLLKLLCLPVISVNKVWIQCITINNLMFQFYTVVRNVKKAHQIQESGEFQEFNDDVEYILDALQDNNPIGTRYVLWFVEAGDVTLIETDVSVCNCMLELIISYLTS